MLPSVILFAGDYSIHLSISPRSAAVSTPLKTTLAALPVMPFKTLFGVPLEIGELPAINRRRGFYFSPSVADIRGSLIHRVTGTVRKPSYFYALS